MYEPGGIWGTTKCPKSFGFGGTKGRLEAPKWTISVARVWQNAEAAPAENTIALRSVQGSDPILGFGAALTDAACYVLSRLPEIERDALLRELFHPDEMALSVCRLCIGSSDYATRVYSYDEGGPDP